MSMVKLHPLRSTILWREKARSMRGLVSAHTKRVAVLIFRVFCLSRPTQIESPVLAAQPAVGQPQSNQYESDVYQSKINVYFGVVAIVWLVSFISAFRLNQRQILFEVGFMSAWTGSTAGWFHNTRCGRECLYLQQRASSECIHEVF